MLQHFFKVIRCCPFSSMAIHRATRSVSSPKNILCNELSFCVLRRPPSRLLHKSNQRKCFLIKDKSSFFGLNEHQVIHKCKDLKPSSHSNQFQCQFNTCKHQHYHRQQYMRWLISLPVVTTIFLCTYMHNENMYVLQDCEVTCQQDKMRKKEDSSSSLFERIDVSRFEGVIANEQDFALLVSFLRNQHGITLRRLLGVGSASVIFEADVHTDDDMHHAFHAPKETVVIKIMDRKLVCMCA